MKFCLFNAAWDIICLLVSQLLKHPLVAFSGFEPHCEGKTLNFCFEVQLALWK